MLLLAAGHSYVPIGKCACFINVVDKWACCKCRRFIIVDKNSMRKGGPMDRHAEGKCTVSHATQMDHAATARHAGRADGSTLTNAHKNAVNVQGVRIKNDDQNVPHATRMAAPWATVTFVAHCSVLRQCCSSRNHDTPVSNLTQPPHAPQN
jgi:hypothetical protein